MRDEGFGAMKAVVFDRDAGGLSLRSDVQVPLPQEGECLVRVRLGGISAMDLQIAQSHTSFRGILGHEWVGEVMSGSSAWKAKRVVAEVNCVCRRCSMCQSGLSNHCMKKTMMGIDGRDGGFAEFVAVPERNLHEIPDVLRDEQAVFVEPLAAAYQVLVQCPIDPRMRVCVLGAGRLGLLVAQAIASKGVRPLVLGRNRDKLLLCEKMGLPARHVDEHKSRAEHHIVVECTGSPAGMELAMMLVRPRGTIVLKSTWTDAGLVNLAPLVAGEVTLLGSGHGSYSEAIAALARGAVEVRTMISGRFPLERVLTAFEAARKPETLKILLAMPSS